MIKFLDQIVAYLTGNELLLILFVASLIYLLLAEKRIRMRIVLPLLGINLLTFNPFFFNKIYFWLLCTYLIITITIIYLLRRINNEIIEHIIFVVLIILIILLGHDLYRDNDMVSSINGEKLPYGVKEVCDIMLSLEKEPRSINDRELAKYIRAYSADIKQLSGVDDNGELVFNSDEIKKVYDAYEEDDMYSVLNYATRKNYNFVVVGYDKKIDSAVLQMMGFEELYSLENAYRLYYYVGVKR